jgi:hypothetical protein
MEIQKEKRFNFSVNEHEVWYLRVALKRLGTHYLTLAHESQYEAEEKCIKDNYSAIHFGMYKEINKIVDTIDSVYMH